MQNFINDYLDVFIFAVIAVILLWRLRSVLGTRSDNDPSPLPNRLIIPKRDKTTMKTISGNVSFDDAALSRDKNANPAEIRPVRNWTQNLPDFNLVASATVHSILTQLPAFDPEFRPDDFMEKARKSFVLIVQAYAGGNKNTLEMLLSPTLFRHFAETIDAREQRKESYVTQLHGLQKALISDVVLEGSIAKITVDFIAEQSISHKDADGKFMDGRDGRRVVTRDRWVFSRDLKAASPFWLLDTTLEHAE